MTEKQFWMKMEQLTQKRRKTGVMGEAAITLREAYQENLRVIAAVRHNPEDPSVCYQLYVGMKEEKPEPANNRFLICYSSWDRAKKDPLLPEGCELLSVRDVIDNMNNKPVIGGLVFNRNDGDDSIIIPKALFSDTPGNMLRAVADVLDTVGVPETIAPELIETGDFERVDVRAGTVLEVKPNKKSRNPAYVLTIDFGSELGVKKSSAQITTLYQPEDLIGTQVICCVNLAPKHIGSVKSEVRVLGTDSEQGVVLLRPSQPVKNGDRVF